VAAPAGGVLATAVAPDPGVVQDALDAPTDPASGLGLLRPDLLKDAKDQGGVHVLYRQLTDDRPGVGVERVLPLLGVLLVSPARAVGGDVLPGALGEADRAGLLELFLSPVALARRQWVSARPRAAGGRPRPSSEPRQGSHRAPIQGPFRAILRAACTGRSSSCSPSGLLADTARRHRSNSPAPSPFRPSSLRACARRGSLRILICQVRIPLRSTTFLPTLRIRPVPAHI